MKVSGRIAYWLVAVTLVASILTSLDYTLSQATFVALLFCPCALALEYWIPKARKAIDKIYLSLAILMSVITLTLVIHSVIGPEAPTGAYPSHQKDISPILTNPAFLGLILTSLSVGDYLWTRWLSKRFKEKDRSITFFSDRRSVTIPVADITYIESNDTEVRIITVSGESYRNKTGISQWENLLGDGFLRIHRSYLVNFSYAKYVGADTIIIGETQLPISKKYKESIALRYEYNSNK